MGKRRHKSRQLALQMLYAKVFQDALPCEFLPDMLACDMVSEKDWTDFSEGLIEKTLEHVEELDAEIDAVLVNWRLERLSRVDLTLLRLALCEMHYFDDVPVRVTINEYVEIAKEFGTDDSFAFVNGILDKLGRGFSEKDFEQK